MLSARTGYAIIAELEVEPDAFDAFVEGLRENARLSLSREPGCLHFDVQAGRGTARVTLLEAYLARSDFEAHLATEHFPAWKARFAPLITARSSVHLKAVPD